MWHYLRDPTFSRFDTIPECDRHTDIHTHRHKTLAYTALSIAVARKNRKIFIWRTKSESSFSLAGVAHI